MAKQTDVGAVLHRDHCSRITPTNRGPYLRRVFQFQMSLKGEDCCRRPRFVGGFVAEFGSGRSPNSHPIDATMGARRSPATLRYLVARFLPPFIRLLATSEYRQDAWATL